MPPSYWFALKLPKKKPASAKYTQSRNILLKQVLIIYVVMLIR